MDAGYGAIGRSVPTERRRRGVPLNAALVAGAAVAVCCCLVAISVRGFGFPGGSRAELIYVGGGDPTAEDGLREMNETGHIFKDPRSGKNNGWSNNFVGLRTPIKNWSPIGEDVMREGAADVFVSLRNASLNETAVAAPEVCEAIGADEICESTHGCYYDYIRGCVNDDLAKPLMEDPTEESYVKHPLVAAATEGVLPEMFPEWDRRIHCGADQSQVECEPDFRYNNPVSRIHTFTKGLKRVDLQREEDDGRDESGFVKDKHDQVPLKRWFETIRVCNGKPEEPEDDDEGDDDLIPAEGAVPDLTQGPGNVCVGYDPKKAVSRKLCKKPPLSDFCRYDTDCGCIPQACVCADHDCVFGVIEKKEEPAAEAEGGAESSDNATNATAAPWDWHGCIDVKVPHLSSRSEWHRGDHLVNCDPQSHEYDASKCPGWVFGRGMHPDRDVSRHTIGWGTGHYMKEAKDGRYYMVDVFGNAIVPNQPSLGDHHDANLFGKAVGCPGCHPCVVNGRDSACLPSSAPKPTYAVRYKGPWTWEVDASGELHWMPDPGHDKKHHTRATWGFGHDDSKRLKHQEVQEYGSWFGLGGDRLLPREESVNKIGRMQNVPDYLSSGGYSGWYKVVNGERFLIPDGWMKNETNATSWSNFKGGYFGGKWLGPQTVPEAPPAMKGLGQAGLRAGAGGKVRMLTLSSRAPRETARAAVEAARGRREGKGVKFYYLPPQAKGTRGGDEEVKGWKEKRPFSLWKMLGLEGKQVVSNGGGVELLGEGRKRQDGIKRGADASGGFIKGVDGVTIEHE